VAALVRKSGTDVLSRMWQKSLAFRRQSPVCFGSFSQDQHPHTGLGQSQAAMGVGNIEKFAQINRLEDNASRRVEIADTSMKWY
jgi:hypothetical protein